MGVVLTAHALYSGADRIDVTTREADPIGGPFAPSFELRMKALDGRFDPEGGEAAWAEFVLDYRLEVRRAAVRQPEAWRALLDRHSTTLVCYCTRPERCHRTILAQLLAEDGASHDGERPFPYGGRPSEWTPAATLVEETA